MVEPKEYIIKFYDGLTVMKEEVVYADNPNDALKIALKQVKGLVSFNKVRLKLIG